MPPGSAHRPTVSQGRALVLYLLPDGRIEFTKYQAPDDHLCSPIRQRPLAGRHRRRHDR
jgi:hypothetical protein